MLAVTWWQVLLVFGCIPAAAFGVIWLVTSLLCQARVPDGLAAKYEAERILGTDPEPGPGPGIAHPTVRGQPAPPPEDDR